MFSTEIIALGDWVIDIFTLAIHAALWGFVRGVCLHFVRCKRCAIDCDSRDDQLI